MKTLDANWYQLEQDKICRKRFLAVCLVYSNDGKKCTRHDAKQVGESTSDPFDIVEKTLHP